MAFSLPSFKKIKDAIRDVFDANTQADQKRRLAAGQPRYYQQQVAQRPTPIQQIVRQAPRIARGLSNPLPEAINFVPRPIRRPLQQGVTAGVRTGIVEPLIDTGAMAVNALTPKIVKKPVSQAVQNVTNRQKAVLRVVAPTPTDTAGRLVQTGTELASLFAPSTAATKAAKATQTVGKLAQGGRIARTGARLLPELAGGAASSAAYSAQEQAKGNNPSLGRELAIGAGIDIATLGLGKVVGKVAGKASGAVGRGATRFIENADNKIIEQGKKAQAAGKTVKTVDVAPMTSPNAPVKPTQVVSVNNGSFRSRLANELGSAIVDKDTPIIRELKNIERQTGATGLVDEFLNTSTTQRQSNSIANHLFANSENIQRAYGGLNKGGRKAFSEFANARRELANAAQGLPTSRPPEQLDAIVRGGEAEFAPRFDALNKYYNDLAGKLHEAGMIDDVKYQQFIEDPDYIRIQREMDDLVGAGKGGNSYSMSAQGSVVSKRRTGSERAAHDAGHTAIDYTQKVIREINRNRTSTRLLDTLEAAGLAQRVTNTKNKNTLSRVVNGVTEVFEVDQAIKETAQNIKPIHLGILRQIVGAPGRALRSGTTALNPVFTAANYVKDQTGSLVLSRNAMATHFSARNLGRGFWESVKDSVGAENEPLWNEFISLMGDAASYDLTRNAKNASRLLREVAEGQGGRVKNYITSPVRTLEDFNAITEKATRYQNFKGTFNDAIKKGKTREQAIEMATTAARQNSVDFSRSGHITEFLNLIFPYFNPAVQGSRQLTKTIGNRPVATIAKIGLHISTPVMAATIWNLSDPDRAAIYANLKDYEKNNNLIFILDNTTQNEDKTYNVIKVPLPPGMGELASLGRRGVEYAYTQAPQSLVTIAQDIAGAFSGPIKVSSMNEFESSVTPQVAKPYINQKNNRDTYTGEPIIREDMLEYQPDATERAYPWTSKTAKIAGKVLNTEPLRVERAVKDVFGTVGTNVLRASDRSIEGRPAAALGELLGGEGYKRRFAVAQGKQDFTGNKGEGITPSPERQRELAESQKELKTITKGLTRTQRERYEAYSAYDQNTKGEPVFRDNPFNKTQRATLLQDDGVFKTAKRAAELKNKQTGQPIDPIFSQSEQTRRVLLWKDSLPPGTKDDTVSKIYDTEWYQNYRAEKSKFYDDKLAWSKKQGYKTDERDSDYPVASTQLQSKLDAYNKLPKGTGARSRMLEANPDILAYWDDKEAWTDGERIKVGLGPLDDAFGGSSGGGSSFARSGSGGSRGGRGSKVVSVSPNATKISTRKAPSVSVKGVSAPKVAVRAKSKKNNKARVTSRKLKG